MHLVSRLRRPLSHLRREDGQTLAIVVMLIAMLSLLAALLTDTMLSSQTRSAASARQSDARAAAEAGIDSYISSLLLDNQYYLQYLAPGEATRKSTSTGGTVASVLPPSSPAAWPTNYGRQWTYPNGKDAWVDLGNGYSYDLQMTPPQTGSNNTNYLQIVATGKANSGGTVEDRQVLQALIRPASVADFQMLSNATVTYGSDAVTTGKIYSAQNVNFQGKAYADIYAEGQVCLSSCGGQIFSPAKWYDKDSSPTIRSVITSPINFASFQVSLDDISRAAKNAGGIYLPSDGSEDAYELRFDTGNKVAYRKCNDAKNFSGGKIPIEITKPTCSASWTSQTIPTNGAIYSDMPVLIGDGTSTCYDPTLKKNLTNADCVDGRVTVASNQDIVIGDDMGYQVDGTDVLGLMAKNDVFVAGWVANSGASLTWRAAALAENGCWSEPQPACDGQSVPNGGNGTMTYTGSSATYLGGAMDMFANRSYNYDATLQYLQPPWFPTLPQAYTILLYRNLPNAS